MNDSIKMIGYKRLRFAGTAGRGRIILVAATIVLPK
jgi:hypothetical protein